MFGLGLAMGVGILITYAYRFLLCPRQNALLVRLCVRPYLTKRVREILISVDFVALYFIAHDRKLRKVPREFFKL
jgi:hypothetical protein